MFVQCSAAGLEGESGGEGGRSTKKERDEHFVREVLLWEVARPCPRQQHEAGRHGHVYGPR